MDFSKMNNKLDQIKQQKWFYEFKLPDGTKTTSYLPEAVRKIHETRETALRGYLDFCTAKGGFESALDISCHEGFFSLILAEHFAKVTGIDKNPDSIAKAALITEVTSEKMIRFVHTNVEDWQAKDGADFVLCFGLLYHVENPIEIMRRLAMLTKKAICIETQILPIQTTGRIEDGGYMYQRDIGGLFGLCADYSSSKEGGRTDLALVPSRDALVLLLNLFGFSNIQFYAPTPLDYEQYVRHHRVIVFAEKNIDG